MSRATMRRGSLDAENDGTDSRLIQWRGRCSVSRVLLVLGSLAAGCSAGSGAYQSALPTREAVAITVPGSSGSPSGAKPEVLGAQATFYTMTVQISTQLNGAAASFFDMIDDAISGIDSTVPVTSRSA